VNQQNMNVSPYNQVNQSGKESYAARFIGENNLKNASAEDSHVPSRNAKPEQMNFHNSTKI
jgi:hypothetical protein